MILTVLIYLVTVVGVIWAYMNAKAVTDIELEGIKGDQYINLDDSTKMDKIKNMIEIGKKIENGANTFLYQEYIIMTVFVVFFGALVFGIVDFVGNTTSKGFSCYATAAYVIGSFTSMICGWIGMKIAVVSNFRTTFKAMYIPQ